MTVDHEADPGWVVVPAVSRLHCPAATFGLNRYMAACQTPWPPGGGGLVDPARMVTVEAFLAAKAELPEQLPKVS